MKVYWDYIDGKFCVYGSTLEYSTLKELEQDWKQYCESREEECELEHLETKETA